MNRSFFFQGISRGSLLVLSSIVLALAGWYARSVAPGVSGPYPETVSVGTTVYTLEIADTPEEQAQGLGDRESLCATCAMLFVFEKPGTYGFWMKGMRFPLDIAWLSGEKVIHIERQIAPENRNVYRPELPATGVLEFNAGALAAVQPGDTVQFTFLAR